MHQAQPRRFVVSASMTDEEHDFCFGRQVDMDLLWIQARPVLHVVDHDTGFKAAYFVTGETTVLIWEAVLSCWSLIYDGMPKALPVDQGPYFVSQRWKSLCNENNFQLKFVPIQSHNSIGVVESRHTCCVGPSTSCVTTSRNCLMNCTCFTPSRR
jgi:hypothetical protein